MKILLVYAASGAGHKKASQAIFEALKKHPLAPKLSVNIINALDYTPDFFRRSYPAVYEFSVTYLPSLWGFFYYFFNNQFIYKIISPLRRLINQVNSKPLVKFLLDNNPDVVVFTHFFASEIAAHLKKQGKISGKLITVITDFGLHSFWVNKYIDQYLVAAPDTKEELTKWGISIDRIRVTGIPISGAFSADLNRQELLSKLNLKENLFTILVGSGGFGAGPVAKIVKALDKLNQPVQILVVCGTNKKLCHRVKNIKLKSQVFLNAYGFVENMPELMSLSQVMVSKSGGLTCSEALAKKLPLIIISPIPGQERGNCRILVKYGAAYKAKNIVSVVVKIQEFLNSPNLLNTFKEQAWLLAKPNSAGEIADLITTHIT